MNENFGRGMDNFSDFESGEDNSSYNSPQVGINEKL